MLFWFLNVRLYIFKLANLLIDHHADLEERNDEGYTPLMEAAREGHEEMVALLLFHDADLNAITDETQETALTLACCGGCYEVAKFLLEAGADPNLGAAATPLMEAAQEGHLELVQLLVHAGADCNKFTTTTTNAPAPPSPLSLPTTTTTTTNTLSNSAAAASHNQQQRTSCESALTLACENGHTAVAEELVRAGAVVDAADPERGFTALMRAARNGQLCTVQWLLTHCGEKIDVNRATVGNEHTALSLACAAGHALVAEQLLQHGANPLHKLSDNRTCLIEASRNGHMKCVELLIDWNYNLNNSAAEASGEPTTSTTKAVSVENILKTFDSSKNFFFRLLDFKTTSSTCKISKILVRFKSMHIFMSFKNFIMYIFVM